jgi:nicotinate-nucleotide adenylyltransferase
LTAAASTGRRIGLLGGSFDPVHNAHVALARSALDHLPLDEVWWLPAGVAWQKGGARASARHRAAMVALVVAEEPRFRLERCELDRPGPSYTIDTVQALQLQWPGTRWTLIVGQDQYGRLHTWHRWRELLPLATWAVSGRAGDAPRPSAEVAALAHRAVALPLPPMSESATEIRRRIAESQDIGALVPDAVARYIAQHHLYRRTP